MKFRLSAAMMFFAVSLSAQQVAPPAACSFDTAAHTDTLSLQFAIRVFHDGDTKPDAALTRAVGEVLRGSFRPTASIGALFSPNSYFASPGKQHYSQVLGSNRIVIQPNGSTSGRWPSPMADTPTQRAVDSALANTASSDGFRQLMVSHHWRKPEAMLVQFVAVTDDIMADQAPLLRVRVPMIRIEGDSVDQMFSRGKPETVHPSHAYDKLGSSGGRPIVVDASGQLTQSGPEVVVVSSDGTKRTNYIRFAPARVGGCPVAFALPLPVKLFP